MEMMIWRGIIVVALMLNVVAGQAAEDEPKSTSADSVTEQKADRIHVFSRSQLKYGLERDNYLSRWIDRPLFVDPVLASAATEDAMINASSFRKMRQTALEYGLDGFAFFPESSGRKAAYELVDPEEPFFLLTEFSSRGEDAEKVAIAEAALRNKNAFRLDGKVVITSYSADRRPPQYWQELFQKIRGKSGDNFIFLPAITDFGGISLSEWVERFDRGEISASDSEKIKASLREWARATDGLYFSYTAGVKTDRSFHRSFYENFVIRHMKEVLDEPEFQGKYFALAANIGHENCTRFGYTQSSDGTKTLRDSFEAAMQAGPDIINVPEWDEQNENTSLRPTVYNSLSSMRILRFYTSQIKGTNAVALEGDDLTLPNVVLSYRKTLTAGEKVEIEVLNIPDSVVPSDQRKKSEFTARVALRDPEGRLVFTSDDLIFDRDRLMDHTVTVPSESVLAGKVLIPELTIKGADGERFFQEGLHYIELRPTWNWDYKWVKQPLRDLLRCQIVEKVGDLQPDGTRWIEVKISADEPFAHVEVLDNDNVIYSHSEEGKEPREDRDNLMLSITWQSLKLSSLRGTISLQDSSGTWIKPGENEGTVSGPTLDLDGVRANAWIRRVFLSIPKSEVDRAQLDFDLPGIYQGSLPVNRITQNEAVGIPGMDGLNFVVSRYLRQNRIPAQLHKNEVAFSIPLLADQPASIVHVQAVGKSGRLYRSKPTVLSSGTTVPRTTRVFSDTENHAVEIQSDSDSIPDIRYTFTPEHGSILYTTAGRMLWGILGGFTSQAIERGGGESRDGTPFLRESDFPAGQSETHPKWVEVEGKEFALEFNGKSSFVALPQGVIPRRSAFTISMQIMPFSDRGKEIIISNRSYYPGSFGIGRKDGKLTATFLGENQSVANFDSGLKLEPNVWQDLDIVYDGTALKFVVNGVESKPLPVKGPGYYDTTSVLGGYGDAWFKGRIKSLRIRHWADTQKDEDPPKISTL